MKKNKIIDKSVHIHQGKKLSLNINIKEQQILTEKQKLFLEFNNLFDVIHSLLT